MKMTHLARLHDKIKVAFLEGRLFFGGWMKAGPPKKPLLF